MSLGPKKITQLPAKTFVANNDIFCMVDVNAGTTKYVTGTVLANYIDAQVAGGATTDVLFNDGGYANGVAGFTFDKTSNTVVVSNTLVTSNLSVTYVTANGSVGSDGQALTTNSTGGVYWSSIGGSTSPGGANTQIQFNDSGAFNGNSAFTYDNSTSTVVLQSACNVITANHSGIYLVGTGMDVRVQSNVYATNIGDDDHYYNHVTKAYLDNVVSVSITANSVLGTTGQILTSNSSGGIYWNNPAASVSVAGSNTQIQYNNSGALGADSTFTYDTATGELTANVFVGQAAYGTTNSFNVGYIGLPQNFTNTSVTLALTDQGGHIYSQNSGAGTQTITIAPHNSVALPIGAAITIVLQSAGTLLVANGAGVNLYLAGNSTARSSINVNSYGVATVLQVQQDNWILNGVGVA